MNNAGTGRLSRPTLEQCTKRGFGRGKPPEPLCVKQTIHDEMKGKDHDDGQ